MLLMIKKNTLITYHLFICKVKVVSVGELSNPLVRTTIFKVFLFVVEWGSMLLMIKENTVVQKICSETS